MVARRSSRQGASRRGLAAALALSLGVAACTGGGGDDADEDRPDEPTSTSTSTSIAEEVPLPDSLAELVGPVPGLDPGAAQQWYLEREVERQEAMVACMADAGFEYTPIDPAELSEAPWDAQIQWSSEEWVRTYGFGVSTLRYPRSALGPDLVGYVDDAADDEPHPDDVYLESLSEDDRSAWHDAQTDCDSRTWQDSRAENLAAAFNQRFSSEITEMYGDLRDDPRYQQILDGIRSCVDEAGVDYTDHETTLTSIEERLAPVDEAVRTGDLDETARAELAAVQQDEIAVATVVDECGGRFLSDHPAYRDLLSEYESEFIEQHAEELRDFLSQADP